MVVDSLKRREFLLATAGLASFFAAGTAEASVARSVSLKELVQHSRSVVVATPLGASSNWERLAGSRRIVTYTRVRVDQLVRGADPGTSELVVRTLGGSVGKIGQLVEGQAELRAGQSSLLFTLELERDIYGVTALAQGEYRVVAESSGRILRPSRLLPKLVGGNDSALQRLTGKPLADALGIVRAVQL
jgi:hypothetical protein